MEVKKERPVVDFSELCVRVEEVRPTVTGVEVGVRNLHHGLAFLRHGNEPPFDMLVDITCEDRLLRGGEERFVVFYQLRSSRGGKCIEVVSALREGEDLVSVVALWPAAAWLEMEIRDFFGLHFCGHPDQRRLFFLDSHSGYPLRKDYCPIEDLEPAREFVSALVTEEAEEEDGEVNLLEFGLSHPAWGRAQNIALGVEGDRVRQVEIRLGHAHAGIEKLVETRPYMSGVEIAARLGPRCARAATLAFVLATEELLSIEAPPRAQAIRVIGLELERIVAYLAWFADLAQHADSHAVCRYAWEVRSAAAVLLQGVPVAQVGGIQVDIEPALAAELAALCSSLPGVVRALDAALLSSGGWSDRARGVGVLGGALALAWGASGPVLRASGVSADRRLDAPYCDYGASSFAAIIGEYGDTWDRCYIRLREIERSATLISERLLTLPVDSWRLIDEKLVVPVVHERSSVEAMIHHHGIWMHGHGLQPPVGKTAFVSVEAPAGELACFMVSDGSDRPCRLHFRVPSLLHAQIFPRLAVGLSIERAELVWDSLDISAAEMDR